MRSWGRGGPHQGSRWLRTLRHQPLNFKVRPFEPKFIGVIMKIEEMNPKSKTLVAATKSFYGPYFPGTGLLSKFSPQAIKGTAVMIIYTSFHIPNKFTKQVDSDRQRSCVRVLLAI